MKTIARTLLAFGLVGLAACSSSSSPSSEAPSTPDPAPSATPDPAPAAGNPSGSGETVSASIDNTTGGAVALTDGTKIDVPAGALPPGVTSISVTSSPQAAGSEYEAISPLYVFGPDGTVFAKPLTVTMPLKGADPASLDSLAVYWSRTGAEGYDMLATTFQQGASGYAAVAQVQHFSSGFCGKKFATDPHPRKDPYADEHGDK